MHEGHEQSRRAPRRSMKCCGQETVSAKVICSSVAYLDKYGVGKVASEGNERGQFQDRVEVIWELG